MNKTWAEIKGSYRYGLFISIFFFIFSFIQTPEYEKSDLVIKSVTLFETPKFKRVGRKGKSVELKFRGYPTIYKIKGIDYKYLIYKKFKKEIKKGDRIKVGIKDEIALSIVKDGFDFMRFEQAQYHKKKNKLFVRYLSIAIFVLCIFPLLFKKRPTYKFKGKSHKIEFNVIFFIGLILTLIWLFFKIGFNFVSGAEFID